MSKVCADCWYVLRPDEYAPMTYNIGTCVMCDADAFVFIVSKREVEAHKQAEAAVPYHPR